MTKHLTMHFPDRIPVVKQSTTVQSTLNRHIPNHETHTSALSLRGSQINHPYYVKSLVLSSTGANVLDLKELIIWSERSIYTKNNGQFT